MKKSGLTKRETQIMNVLWNSDVPLSSNDILQKEPELSRNTIQIVLKKLTQIGFIEIAGFGYNKNALTRTFRPIVSQEEYLWESLSDDTMERLAESCVLRTSSTEFLRKLDGMIHQRMELLKN
ncbi:MAG: BlaI/MecI/CopY family transcriptional regulator [Ileibacterium sp.]|nr:BlaI/MecI/CopY family transcriptional regulator [Ileibacterium sp.]